MSEKRPVDDILKETSDEVAKILQEDKKADLTETLKGTLVKILAAQIKEEEEDNLKDEVKKVKAVMLHKKATDSLESGRAKFRRYIFGPFQFLVACLIMAEGLLVYWMYQINSFIDDIGDSISVSIADSVTANVAAYVPPNVIDTIFYERIVVGSLSIAVLIAVLVVFSVVYKIKKAKGDCEH